MTSEAAEFAMQDIKDCENKEINLSDRGLTNKDIPEIVAALNNKAKINHVDLSRNNLDDDCLESLCCLKHVTGVNLAHNDFDKSTISLIGKFKYVNLMQNCVTQQTAEKILTYENRIACTYLNLERNELSEEMMKKVKEKLDPASSRQAQIGFFPKPPITRPEFFADDQAPGTFFSSIKSLVRRTLKM